MESANRRLQRLRSAICVKSHGEAEATKLESSDCGKSDVVTTTLAATPQQERNDVCLVVGAGAGIGQAVAARFAREGMHVVVVRRGGGKTSLSDGDTKINFNKFVESIRENGGAATPMFADATDHNQMAIVVKRIEHNIGPIAVAVYNIGAQFGNRTLEKTTYKIFNLGLRMGALGGFILAKEVTPFMIARSRGTIIFTSSTAAFRGNSGQHAHTSAMGARRNLAQSLNDELGPQGIHICHVNVDGPVLSPETLGKMMPVIYRTMKAELLPRQGIILPTSIAEHYWQLYKQPRDAWTFELDIRPWEEKPWFNS